MKYCQFFAALFFSFFLGQSPCLGGQSETNGTDFDTDPDMEAWASRHHLSKETQRVLTQQGFTSLELLRHLSANDVTESFQKPGLLPLAQCMALKKGLQQLCDDGDSSTSSTVAAAARKYKTTRHQSANNNYRFLLLGKTGSGKSTTGNTILGEELFSVGTTFESVTAECELRRRTNLGKNMEIMDSPGLFDTRKTHEEIAIDIVRSVAGMHPGPHAILYVIPLGRYTDEEYAVYKRLKALFDEHLTKYLIVLFTGGDRLRPGETMEKMLKKIPQGLSKVLEECGDRYILFNNYAPDPSPQVERLLQMVDTMIKTNGGKPYTCPKYDAVGQGLEQEVQRRLAEVEKRDVQRTKYVQQLQRDTKAAQQAVRKERESFQRKEAEREAEVKREEERRQREMRELKRKMEEEKLSLERQRDEERKKREEMEAERQAQLKAMQGVVLDTRGQGRVARSTDWSVVLEVTGQAVVVDTQYEDLQSMNVGGNSIKVKTSSNHGRVTFNSTNTKASIRTSTSGVIIEAMSQQGVTIFGMGQKGVIVSTDGPLLTVVVSGQILGVE